MFRRQEPHPADRTSIAPPKRSRLWRALGALVLGVSALACNEHELDLPPDAGAAVPEGLTPEQAAAVVARVGDRTITLGDVVAQIEAVNPYYRRRFQNKEWRRKMLDDMIDMELLAIEAKRRGLGQDARTSEQLRQVLRDAMLAEARKGVPAIAEITADEVRSYYQEHIDRFREPERRRVAAIVASKKDVAEKVLAKLLADGGGASWGELFRDYSETANAKTSSQTPNDLLGDLGIVGPPGDAKGGSVKVPEAVRAALFELVEVGMVHRDLVEADGRWFVVKLIGRTAGHTKTLEEATQNIRVILRQQKVQEREQELEARLRARFPVTIDDKALEQVVVPGAVDKVEAYWEKDGGAVDEPPDAGPGPDAPATPGSGVPAGP